MKFNKALKGIMWVIGIVISIFIGGLFINGTSTSVMFLEYLPLIIHQIIGWIIIATTVIAAIVQVTSKKRK